MISNRHKRLVHLQAEAEKTTGDYGKGLKDAAAVIADGVEIGSAKPKAPKKKEGLFTKKNKEDQKDDEFKEESKD